MEKKPTRDRILESALTLFAEKGYDGVGVDLIAEKAGIKGPSLYKHFKSKEDILYELIAKVEVHYENNFGSEEHPGKTPASMDGLISMALDKITFTINDPLVTKIRRLLTMEQFRNPRIALLATKYNIELVQGLFEKIFRSMMDNGIMKTSDPKLLSMSFASPVSLLIQMCDREPERQEEVMGLIKSYLKFFAEANKA